MTLFAYRWYLLTGPRIGASCVYLSFSISSSPCSVPSSSLSLFIPLFHFPFSLLSLLISRSSWYIPLSQFSLCPLPPPYPFSLTFSRSLIPARIKMKMDRTARQMAKWIYAGRGRNFHFSVANCMPRLSAAGGALPKFSADIFCI